MDNNINIESEKSEGISRETSLAVIITAVIVSCVVHVALMFACADCEFAPLHMDVKRDKKWTKEQPIMQVRKMDVDPYKEIKAEMARPVAAPDNEKQEERVERLSQASKSDVTPQMPAAASSVAIADTAADPVRVDPKEWQPREQIMVVDSPVVPDESAALPRIIIPKIERVRGAADITPSYAISAPTSVAVADKDSLFKPQAFTDAPEISSMPIPAPSAAFAETTASLASADASAALFDAETTRAKERAEKAAELLNAEKKSVPPAPKTTAVDEKIVESSKEAVRALRDDTIDQGKPFHENVSVGLGSWIDPARPDMKYFRISISSRAEKPLPVVPKDMVFLLDASGSIGNDRLKSCRKAVLAATKLLNTGDRFNIIAFRDKFTFAFPEVAWQEVTKESLERAEDWLSGLAAHGQTDVFRTLRGVMAMPRVPSRPVVALVVTDGDATSGMTRSAEIISRLGELNGGLISMFMYGVKENANAYLMDMLTRTNRGSWERHEGYRWNAASKIPELAKKFQRPVMSDISVMFSASSQTEAYPQLVSNLCEDVPLEIYGRCPASQKEVVFSLRGLNGETVFENMFRLAFDDSAKMTSAVRDDWAKNRLYALIAAYTTKRDPSIMNEIRSFAAQYNLTIPYEKEMKR